MIERKQAIVALIVAYSCALAFVLPTHAETKVLTAEATYTMSDGETPSFAEAMALQKAKQIALEQAGTYVGSYTKIQNLDLTTEEIQTIAGGVLQVEVLDKSRTLIGDGVRFYTKIRATVTTDKMEELAQRIKGKNVAEEYKKLQEDYARLTKEIETWKHLLAQFPPGRERDTALDQIREREQTFAGLQKTEAALFQRLVSGEALLRKAQDERAVIDNLFQKILKQGYLVTIGEPTLHRMEGEPVQVKLRIPVSLRVSDTIRRTMEDVARSLGGNVAAQRFVHKFHDGEKRETHGVIIRLSKDHEVARYFQRRVNALAFALNVALDDAEGPTCLVESSEMLPIAGAFQVLRPPSKLFHDEWIPVPWIADDGTTLFIGSEVPVDKPVSEIMGYPVKTRDFEQDDSGPVVVFDDTRRFTITMRFPVAIAQHIKAIGGQIAENPLARQFILMPEEKPKANPPQNIGKEEERPWWRGLFGSSEEHRAISSETSPERTLKKVFIFCSIEP